MNPILILEDCELNSYHVRTLDDGNWVSDMIIHFWVRLLEKRYETKDTFYFFIPCVTQLFQGYPVETVKSMMKNVDIRKYSYIFFPMADFNSNTMSASHFSCLYIDNTGAKPVFKHFDSISQKNYQNACQLARSVSKVFGLDDDSVMQLKCVSQNNCYDCGIYVMAYIEAFIQTKKHEAANRLLEITNIHEYREEIKETIYEMAQEKQKQ